MGLANLISRYIEEFVVGEVLHHGSIQITPFRNREYIKKFRKNYLLGTDSSVSQSLGYKDPDINLKKDRFNINNPGLVSQGYLFNIGFGLSVHDISFNAIANLSYKNLTYGKPVFEGDILFGKSIVLGIEVKKDSASNGSIQVKTIITNQRNEVVLEYVRQVLLRTSPGKTIDAQSSLENQPGKINLAETQLPLEYKNLNNNLLGNSGKTFEEFDEDKIYKGGFSSSIKLVDFSWLQISTLNDASVHHNPSSNFIGYGGGVKSTVEGQISNHIPFGYFLGMNSGSHDAPTYPSDIIQSIFNSTDEDDEKIIGSFKVIEKVQIKGRTDMGILTIELRGDKIVTEAGLKAYKKAGFKGITKIKDNKIRVLTMEMCVAIPTDRSFG